MTRRALTPWILALVAIVAACATQGGDKPKSAKKAPGCDNFANPCPAEQVCIDAACRPKACSSDGDCHGSASCLEGACLQRQCKENLSCLGEDETAGTADDRSCIGGVCLPISCPRDGNRCPAPTKERCAWNSDCGSGRLCFGGSCTPAKCVADKDCLPRICYSGLCLDPDCDERRPCRAGKNCVNGLCLVTSAAPD